MAGNRLMRLSLLLGEMSGRSLPIPILMSPIQGLTNCLHTSSNFRKDSENKDNTVRKLLTMLEIVACLVININAIITKWSILSSIVN